MVRAARNGRSPHVPFAAKDRPVCGGDAAPEESCLTTALICTKPAEMAAPPDLGSSTRQGPFDVIRIALGIVLLTAAGLKAYALATGPVPGGGMLGSRPFLIGAVEFELFLGLWLVVGLGAYAAWAVAVATFGSLAAVSFYHGVAGSAGCGCFGRLDIDPWHMFLFDACAVCALLRWPPPVRVARSVVNSGEGRREAWSFVGAVACLGILAALWMNSFVPAVVGDDGSIDGGDALVVLDPSEWVGKKLPLLRHIDVGGRITAGRWRLLLYHHGCADCRKVIDRYAASPGGPAAPRTVLVAVPPFGEEDAAAAAGRADFLSGRLSDRRWFVRTPAELILQDGVVTGVN